MTGGPDNAGAHARSGLPLPNASPERSPARIPTIADMYADLLRPLSNQQRRAMVLRLTFGFYEGWKPTRSEIADLVAVELGTLSSEDALRRKHQRNLRVSRPPGDPSTT